MPKQKDSHEKENESYFDEDGGSERKDGTIMEPDEDGERGESTEGEGGGIGAGGSGGMGEGGSGGRGKGGSGGGQVLMDIQFNINEVWD